MTPIRHNDRNAHTIVDYATSTDKYSSLHRNCSCRWVIGQILEIAVRCTRGSIFHEECCSAWSVSGSFVEPIAMQDTSVEVSGYQVRGDVSRRVIDVADHGVGVAI